MKKLMLFFLLLFSTPLFPATQSTAANQLAKLLNNFTTLAANFSEVTADDSQRVLQKSKGVMMLMKPNYFRFETEKPTHQIVITDGKVLWVYDVDLKQATRQEIQNLPINPAKILSGDVNNFLQKFNVQLMPHQNRLVFQLIPKKQSQAFRSVVLVFRHQELESMQVTASLGQVSTFNFSHLVMNPRLSRAIFHFSPPTGVDILK
ncbi:MAG: outer membrane lipoprotein chaperone LolA [Coxiellaceae bacterium]|nr:outer membrane lipoprotein chaperone LolA [Coxiellaceae bacterium]